MLDKIEFFIIALLYVILFLVGGTVIALCIFGIKGEL